ncbi:MAG: prepilin-type N-terminal cleavage/methylation domain-containing protein [Proteobacteria bacterium]|nr:prepilin-type N-terminal cleavage/methylation domain-containing protein [Pseudomonadota bacterium]
MKFTLKGNKGFSLIELMVVVGIIGILSSLALPRITIFLAKSRQAEVKTNLASMSYLQKTFNMDPVNAGAWGATNAAIGYNVPAGALYTYTTANTGISTGTIAANGLCAGSAVDTWTSNAATMAMANTAPFGTCN